MSTVPAPDGPAVLCWDGSEAAAEAIRDSARLLGDGQPAIVLFAYVPTERARGVLGGVSGPDAPIMAAVEAEELLDRGVAMARDAGLDATGELVVAEAKTAGIIAELAEERNARLIAMGQRRRSALGRLVLGSVTRELLGDFHRPVLVVGPGSPGAHPRGA
ncbi:MAG: universal stress protein [Solirubrobacterales bacterium]|nr:universal stress protein [Solirubrobacterales bacterium]MBV9714770.1 universal stress protein [Solirubrobacterales bacterium]